MVEGDELAVETVGHARPEASAATVRCSHEAKLAVGVTLPLLLTDAFQGAIDPVERTHNTKRLPPAALVATWSGSWGFLEDTRPARGETPGVPLHSESRRASTSAPALHNATHR